MLDEDERGSWHHRGARTWHHMLPAGIDLLDSRNIRKVSDPRDEPILDANIAHKRWAAVAIHDNAVSNHQIHAGHQVLAQGVHACQWCAWTGGGTTSDMPLACRHAPCMVAQPGWCGLRCFGGGFLHATGSLT